MRKSHLLIVLFALAVVVILATQTTSARLAVPRERGDGYGDGGGNGSTTIRYIYGNAIDGQYWWWPTKDTDPYNLVMKFEDTLRIKNLSPDPAYVRILQGDPSPSFGPAGYSGGIGADVLWRINPQTSLDMNCKAQGPATLYADYPNNPLDWFLADCDWD